MNQWLNNLKFEKKKIFSRPNHFFRGLWGQTNFEARPTSCWGPTFGPKLNQANFEAWPNEGTRPGFIVCPDHGAIKLGHAHSCFKSHFYTIYFLQKSEIKSELVYVLWPGPGHRLYLPEIRILHVNRTLVIANWQAVKNNVLTWRTMYWQSVEND